jgi:hypothetical protein
MIKPRSAISFPEIAIVILAGFSVSYVITKNDLRFFALPHITFLVLAVIIRTSAGKWKLSDWGIVPGVGKQIRTGLILWIVVQVYYALGHIFIPLLPVAAQMGAQAYGITTLDALSEKLL